MKYLLLITILLAGCKSVPKTYKAPESAPLIAAQDKAAQHVAKAHAATVRAKVGVTKAKQFHKAEGEEIKAIQGAIDAPEFRNAPPDLLPLIEGIRGQLAIHDATHAQTAGQIEVTVVAVAEAEFESGKAGTIHSEIQTKFGPEYIAKVEALVITLNETERERSDLKNENRTLKSKSFFRKVADVIIGIVILVVVGGGCFLWFTGKLSLAGLRAAR